MEVTDETLEFIQLRYIYGHRVVDQHPELSQDELEPLIYQEWEEFDRIMEERDRKRDASRWLEGWYHATNGKWGLPEKGENPYGEVEE